LKLDFNFVKKIGIRSKGSKAGQTHSKEFSKKVRTQNQTAARSLNSSRAEQKIELVLRSRGGEDAAVLRLSTWTDGLGWCAQKTVELDAAQLDELHLAVTVARRRLASERAEAVQPAPPAKIIRLPTVA
jgi:hypothetical protein